MVAYSLPLPSLSYVIRFFSLVYKVECLLISLPPWSLISFPGWSKKYLIFFPIECYKYSQLWIRIVSNCVEVIKYQFLVLPKPLYPQKKNFPYSTLHTPAFCPCWENSSSSLISCACAVARLQHRHYFTFRSFHLLFLSKLWRSRSLIITKEKHFSRAYKREIPPLLVITFFFFEIKKMRMINLHQLTWKFETPQWRGITQVISWQRAQRP